MFGCYNSTDHGQCYKVGHKIRSWAVVVKVGHTNRSWAVAVEAFSGSRKEMLKSKEMRFSQNVSQNQPLFYFVKLLILNANFWRTKQGNSQLRNQTGVNVIVLEQFQMVYFIGDWYILLK